MRRKIEWVKHGNKTACEFLEKLKYADCIDGSVQQSRSSIANALELGLSPDTNRYLVQSCPAYIYIYMLKWWEIITASWGCMLQSSIWLSDWHTTIKLKYVCSDPTKPQDTLMVFWVNNLGLYFQGLTSAWWQDWNKRTGMKTEGVINVHWLGWLSWC